MIRTSARKVLFRLRRLLRQVPPRWLWFGFWPLAGIAAAFQMACRTGWTARFARLPLPLRPQGRFGTWVVPLWVQLTRSNVSAALSLWADAFAEPRWRELFTFAGEAASRETVETGGQPIVFYTLHFGSQYIVQQWMRSRGLGLAFVHAYPDTRLPPHRLYLNHLVDEAAGLVGVPRLIRYDQPWRMIRHLRRGGVLGIAGSAPGPQPIVVRHGEVALTMSSGAFRLALQTGAKLIPGIFVVNGRAEHVAHLAPAVAQEDLADASRHPEVLASILRFFVEVMQTAPPQMHPYLLDQLSPPVAGRSGEAAGMRPSGLSEPAERR